MNERLVPDHVPVSTYRLQLHDGVTLRDVAERIAYLERLGVEAVYLSPLLTAPEGASHGYHIVDPTRVDPQLGGDHGLAALAEQLGTHQLGLVLDIVPNHLRASSDNPWWHDVLRHGPDSAFADHFDIDWSAAEGRVVLPILGDPIDDVLAGGELVVDEDVDPSVLRYHDHTLPLAPDTDTTGPVEKVLDQQHYRLDHWRTGRPNYRRFFDITDLVGVRVEDPEVFEDRHVRILELIRDGVVTGLRVDHVDGLRDPEGYLAHLRDRAEDAADGGIYLVVEKIVEGDERLPEPWPVDGTTGYELLTDLNGVLVDPHGLGRIGDFYRAFVGSDRDLSDTVHARKLDALTELFPGEVDRLAEAFAALATEVPEVPPLAQDDLRGALVAVTASVPVYRTYIRDLQLRAQDRNVLERTFAEARRRHPDVDGAALVFLEHVLMVDVPIGLAEDVRERWLDLVLRWQQLTGPAMAKGFEDTTFYVANRLISLNEVGVDVHGMTAPPGVASFHDRVRTRAAVRPHTMTATSTHDTKRSEDVRARLAVLTEVTNRWADAVVRWSGRNEHHVEEVAGHRSPDRNEEWLLYQTLVGMWPLDPSEEPDVLPRITRFAVKALREAKVHTSWLDPDTAHEAAVERFLEGALSDEGFVADLRDFAEDIAIPGAVNALTQVLLQIAAPGVPDRYQGTELWDLSLVDPDNRRPVDWDRRRDALDAVEAVAGPDDVDDLRESWRDGRVKLFVVARALRHRRDHRDLYLGGDYEPLRVRGRRAEHLVGALRRRGDRWVAAIGARSPRELTDAWPIGTTWRRSEIDLAAHGIDQQSVSEILTGRVLEAGATLGMDDVFAHLPVALLTAHGWADDG
ncbi:MAG: malto-oligosyltrehalose synthase [Actinobacteria bacterium]|nr:malto-oligosyltrehalose synthase [Actinomycetota bacterium]